MKISSFKSFLILSLFICGLIFSPVSCEKLNTPVYLFEKPETATMDADGNIYLTGGTNAPSFRMDGTPMNPDNQTHFGLFLIKMDPKTPAFRYLSWFRQPAYVDGKGIVVDKDGSPYVLVESESKGYPSSWSLAGDGSERGSYITRFSPDGAAIEESYQVFSTAHTDYKPALNLYRNTDGSLSLAIKTGDTTFHATKNFNESDSSEDVILFKISPDGKKIVYADRIGSRSGIILQSMDVAPGGSAYFAGFTWGGKLNATGFQKTYRGQSDGVIAKISPDGEKLEYVTYLGGKGIDRAISIRAGPDGSAYIAGTTTSDDFPLKNPAIGNRSGFYEGYAAKISPDGQQLLWSTYLGEMSDYEPITIVPASDGGAWVSGGAGANMTRSSGNHFGTTGNGDAFLLKITPDGQIAAPPVIFGGLQRDTATGLILDKDGNPFVFGTTSSFDFPLKNPINDHYVPGFSMFAASFNADDQDIRYITYVGGPVAYTEIGLKSGNECKSGNSQGLLETILSFFTGNRHC